MSYVLVSAEDLHYGPTSLSSEDSMLHQQIADLTISTRTAKSGNGKMDRSEKYKQRLEAKMKELKDKPEKQEKLKEKMEKLNQRERDRVAVIEGKKVKFDPNAKSIVIKVEDGPVRVLNKLFALGYQIVCGNSGGGSSSRFGHVWTLFKAGYLPQMMYPELNNLNIHN